MDRRRFITSIGATAFLCGLGAGLNGAAAQEPRRRPKNPMPRRLMYHVTTPAQVAELQQTGSAYILPRDIFQTGMGNRTVEEVQVVIDTINLLFPRNEVMVASGARRLDDSFALHGYTYAGFDYEESTLPEGEIWNIGDFDGCLDQLDQWISRIQADMAEDWPGGRIALIPTASPLNQPDLGWDYGELASSWDKVALVIPMTQGLAARGVLGPALAKLREDLVAQQYPTLQAGGYVKPCLNPIQAQNQIATVQAEWAAKEIWRQGLGVCGLWGGDIPAYVETMKLVRKPR